jgi:SSS family solute:Na+ symporter
MGYLDYFIVVAYLLVTIMYGLLCKPTSIKERNPQYFRFPTSFMLATVFATVVGGASTYGEMDLVYKKGIWVCIVGWGGVIGLIAVPFCLAPKMLPYIGKKSMGHMVKQMFGPYTKIIITLIGIIVSLGIIGAQFHVMGLMASQLTTLPKWLTLLIGASIITVYTARGGLRGVIITDVFQFMFIMLIIPILLLTAFDIYDPQDNIFDTVLNNVGTFDLTYIDMCFSAMFIGLFPCVIQRILIVRDIRQAQIAFTTTALLSLVLSLALAISVCIMKAKFGDIGDKNIIVYITATVLPTGIKGILVTAILSAIFSSADSNLHMATVSFYEDLDKKFNLKINPRTLTYIFGAISYTISISFNSVINIVMFMIDFWTVSVCLPIILGLIFEVRKIGDKMFIVPMIISILCFSILKIIGGLIGPVMISTCISAGTFLLLFYRKKLFVRVEKEEECINHPI